MKLNNCLLCCCHEDNKKIVKCKYKKHRFSITDKQAVKYNWAIKYIKKEIKGGRHICASLGSAGYTFLDDIEFLANYAYSIGEKNFYKDITKKVIHRCPLYLID